MRTAERPARADAQYFGTRAVQEQVAAGRATSEAARKVHADLAMLYRFRAAMLSTRLASWCDALPVDVPETA